MRISISGFTAAGKTTHASLLAAEYGLQYVSATHVMAEVCNIDYTPDFWPKNADRISELRSTQPIDDMVDAKLVEYSRTYDDVIFDCWAIAWLTEAPMTNIWIESDLHSRTLKCMVSMANTVYRNRSYDWYQQLIVEKDLQTVDIFRRLRGFDYSADPAIHSIIVNNSGLITNPTEADSAQGIRKFHRIIIDELVKVCQT